MSLLGIDVGTSGCKVAVFSEDGSLLAAAYEEYDFQHPQPGWAELNTQQVWEKIKRTIRQAASGAAHHAAVHDPIKALSVSSLGEAVVPVTSDRRVLGPSLLNFDVRGAEYLPELRQRLEASSGASGRLLPIERASTAGTRACSADEMLYRINGNTLGNHFSVTKLLWLKDHQPDLYHQTDRFLHWSGFVSFMLGAEAVVDYSLANRTLLFDLECADWSNELLGVAQLDRDKLPRAVPAGKVIGKVEQSVAEELGLPAHIPIVSGTHDQCSNGLGCGVIEPGRALYGMGTYICMMPVFDRRLDAAAMMAQGLNTEHHAVPGQFVSFIYNQGGVLVKWFRDTFAAMERQQAATTGTDLYAALLAEMPEGPSRVMVLPHFTATGPPRFIGDSCGVMTGLHLDTTRGEILKALIEATTFYIRECFESLPDGMVISDFRAAGGGSKSDAWLQICADILGRPFIRPQINEAGALGAAIVAGVGSGIFASLREGVDTMVKFEQTFTPEPATQRRYDERFAQYRDLWPLLKDYLRASA